VGFDLLSAFKDVQLILQNSSDVHVPLPYANTIRDKFLAAIANDLEKKDWISIYEITRMLAGLKK
jgi:3-hydroxyisobutyrate dehydrogenase-like beta-hydroxyacid dehydrogenase